MKDPLIIALVLGLTLNYLGFYTFLGKSWLLSLYTTTITNLISPVIPIVLILIGYSFNVNHKSLASVMKHVVGRALVMGLAILLIFLIFPTFKTTYELYVAVILYFMTPPALMLATVVEPIFMSKEDEAYIATFVSVYFMITLIVFMFLI